MEADKPAKDSIDTKTTTPPLTTESTQPVPITPVPAVPALSNTGDQHRSKGNNHELREWWKVAVETLTFLAVIVYATFAAFQWCEMQEANRISRTSLEAQTRPWVLIEGEPTSIASAENEITFKINLKNYGPSPAAISNSPEFDLVGDVRPKVAEFDKVCKTADDSIGDAEHPIPWVSVIPPKTEPITQSITARRDSNARLGGNSYWMYGCLAYRGPSGGIHHTRVTYQIQAHDSGPPEPRTFTAEIKGRPIYNFD
jgi:hypothetical protein